MHLRFIIFFSMLLSSLSYSQDRIKLKELNDLNNSPFIPEKNISGNCFVVLSDSFDYYKNPIEIMDINHELLLKIEIDDKFGVITSFRGKRYQNSDTLNPFNPWLWNPNPDYFRLAFECSDTTSEFFKVWLSKKEFTFIRKDNPNFKKQSIIDFVGNYTLFGFDFDRSSNPLRNSSDENSKIITHKSQKNYKIWDGEVIEIKGDWIKLKTTMNEIGWIRWRDGEKINIRMYFVC